MALITVTEGTDHLKEKTMPDNSYLTFDQIAAKARQMSLVPGPGGGAQGIRQDIELAAHMAQALAVFEHNVAAMLVYPPPSGERTTVTEMLAILRRPIPTGTLDAST